MTTSLIPLAQTQAAPVFVLSPHLTRQRPIRVLHHQRAVPPCELGMDLLQAACIRLEPEALAEVSRLERCPKHNGQHPFAICSGTTGYSGHLVALFDGKDAA